MSTPQIELVTIDSAPAAVILPKKWRDPDAGRNRRRSLPIHGYFGRNGSGKSQLVVHDTLPDLDRGDPVLSTMALINADTGEPYPNFELWTEWDQVLTFKRGAIVGDEIVGVAGSRNAMSLPIEVQNLLNQLRRGDIAFRWTAPAWARADLIIRETSQGATLCKGMFPRVLRDEDGRVHTWAQNRWSRVKTYDASDFEEWTAAKEKGTRKLRPVQTAWFRAEGTRARASYDTYAPVTRVGFDLDSGRCASCGGVRRPKPCTCSPVSGRRGAHDHGDPGRTVLEMV